MMLSIPDSGYTIRSQPLEAAAGGGACVLTDSDGDKIFSTFDTRDVDKSQPEMNCGTHIITGGTGKYKGISGREPFACINMPPLAGPGGYTAMDIPTTRPGRSSECDRRARARPRLECVSIRGAVFGEGDTS
jgi:hypothetical protein